MYGSGGGTSVCLGSFALRTLGLGVGFEVSVIGVPFGGAEGVEPTLSLIVGRVDVDGVGVALVGVSGAAGGAILTTGVGGTDGLAGNGTARV